MSSSGLFIPGGGGGISKWSSLTNASANLTLANGGFSSTFNQASAVNWTWANTTAATSGTSQSSPIINISGQYWNGSASAADTWTIQDVIANGTNGTSTLTFTHSGTTGLAGVSFSATNLILTRFQIAQNFAAIASGSWMGLVTTLSGASTGIVSDTGATTNPLGVFIGDFSGLTQPTQSLLGTQYAVAFGHPYNSPSQGRISFVPTAGAIKTIGAGLNMFVNQTGTASGDYTGLQVNVTELAFLGTNALLQDWQIGCSITNIVETVGNVVTLTVVNNKALVGQSVILECLTTGTWLNGQTVVLSAGTNATTLIFTDPTAHGAQASHAEVGRASLSVASLNTLGVITKYNAETTAAPGIPYTRGVTSQKSETGADASVLSVTPAAAVGTYRITIVISVSAATAATLGWTATWTDSNGTAQAPTNLALTQSGVAAPALTFSAAANNVFYGEAYIDVNNAGTAIVVKTTFTGTSIAYKVTATIERLV